MAGRWWGRRVRPVETSDRGAELIRGVAWGSRLEGAEAESYGRVSAVLTRTARASSAGECLNSMLRMQQSQPKRMTQGMLDLKRLYWNCRRLAAGPRKGISAPAKTWDCQWLPSTSGNSSNLPPNN